MTAPTYTCDVCGGTFNKGTTDEAADAEAFELFGVKDASTDPDMGVVCDPCWRAMHAAGAFDVAPPEAS